MHRSQLANWQNTCAMTGEIDGYERSRIQVPMCGFDCINDDIADSRGQYILTTNLNHAGAF